MIHNPTLGEGVEILPHNLEGQITQHFIQFGSDTPHTLGLNLHYQTYLRFDPSGEIFLGVRPTAMVPSLEDMVPVGKWFPLISFACSEGEMESRARTLYQKAMESYISPF